MFIKKFNGLNMVINKQYELILAFHAVYLLKHPELREGELDFIETPNIEYMHDLEKLIIPENYPELIKYITNFTDCSVPIDLGIGINDLYEVDYRKMQTEHINKYMEYGTIEGFALELKKLATDINWNEFFKKSISFYKKFIDEYCHFPDNLDLNDIARYYKVKPKSYTFIPSVLMNGGFGPSDKEGNLYYNMGFYYYDDVKEFYVPNEYIVECLFHEFSHPIVNPLVDKYLANTDILEKFYQDAMKNNLFETYSGRPETVMDEYLVRANAYILASKYFKDSIEPIEDDWVIPHGFTYLPELVYFTEENLPKYENYEEFVSKAIPEFMSSCLSSDMTSSNHNRKIKK